MLENICDWIILIAAVLAAITTICKWFGKPIVLFKKKREAQEAQKKKEFAEEVKNKIIQELSPKLDILMQSSQDLLRKQILELYEAHKYEKKLTQSEKETLDDLFRDYAKEGGNGYIKKKYLRMEKWTIVSDEDEEEKTEE